LEHHGADQTRDRRVVGEDAHDVRAPLDLGVESFERVRRVDLRPMRPREGHEGEHVVLGLVHQRTELGELASKLIGHRSPLRARCVGRLLHEHRADGRRDHASLRLARVRQRVAHEVHAAALPGRLEHLGCRGLDAFVAVADHEFHATQAAPVQAAQELGPERLGFAGADLQAQHFALTFGVHAYSDYYGHAHDAPGLARLHVRGVDPQVRPVALDLAVQERANTLVEFAAQAADLALGDAAHPQRLDQVVHRARGDAVHVGFLDHGGERLLGRAPRLQELGEVAALAQLGDLQLDAAGTRVPRALAVAVAAVDPLGALLVIAGAATPFDIELHEALGHELHHLAQHVDVG